MGKAIFLFFTGLHAKLYKLTGGRFFGGGSDDGSLLVLTHTGAKSGKVRHTPLTFFHHDGGYVIVASVAGSDQNPGWYHNLMANPETTVNVNGETIAVLARDAGEERDALYQQMVDVKPQFGGYVEKTDRVIPVVVLERL